ncbi:MAG: BMC domain-containing protein [Firmicutes bacterium]|nr:BMC domain-containing protein [Bacillota bacterium]
MQALGLIETRGLLAAIEGADVMLKTAQVELLGRTFVGGGLVTILVTGDVGAVKAAVEAGVAAVVKINALALVSQHVIPRPHNDIESMIVVKESSVDKQPSTVSQQQQSENTAAESLEPVTKTKESTTSVPIKLKNAHKESVDDLVQKFGLEKCINALKLLSVAKLRSLAREYKELGIAGRTISKANKDLLIQKLTEYYQRGNN